MGMVNESGHSATDPKLASDSIAGIMKLYSELGTNTDGSVTQSVINTALSAITSSMPNIATGTYAGDNNSYLNFTFSFEPTFMIIFGIQSSSSTSTFNIALLAPTNGNISNNYQGVNVHIDKSSFKTNSINCGLLDNGIIVRDIARDTVNSYGIVYYYIACG